MEYTMIRKIKRTIIRQRKVLMCIILVYIVSTYFKRPIADHRAVARATAPLGIPRHCLIHNGKPCRPPLPSPDFIGVDTPVFAYVYSALHDVRRSQITITMLIQRHRQRFGCGVKFAGTNVYTKVGVGVYVSSYDDLDKNAKGDLINTATLVCNYADYKSKHFAVDPRFVQLVQHENSSVVLATDVPVENIIHPKKRSSLALCLGRVYSEPFCSTCSGMNYTYHLPEWLEMQRLMGVQVVYVYNQSMSRDASTVFSHYARQGFVEILSQAPIHGELTHSPVSLGVSDCMIRNKYQYEHILAMDTDEFLVPTKHDTYQPLIEELFPKLGDKEHHVQFASAFFPTDRNEPAAEPYLKTQSYRGFFQKGHGPGKSIVDPRYCHLATTHTCTYVTRPNATVLVPPEVAMIHHYKDCKSHRLPRKVKPCKQAKLIFNYATSRFRDRLNKAVLNAFHEMGLYGL